MAVSFEIRTYQTLQWNLALVNALCLASAGVLVYSCDLSPEHQARVSSVFGWAESFAGELRVTVYGALALTWGWLSTHILRLHDRVHEPWVRQWRPSYDTDFVLRALLYEHAPTISPDIFERAFHETRIRNKLMEQLFYRFVGDEVEGVRSRRLSIYTELWRYWSTAIVDLYAVAFLIAVAVYHLFAGGSPSTTTVIVLASLGLTGRCLGNKFLHSLHGLTAQQVSSIQQQKGQELEQEVKRLAGEMSFAKPNSDKRPDSSRAVRSGDTKAAQPNGAGRRR